MMCYAFRNGHLGHSAKGFHSVADRQSLETIAFSQHRKYTMEIATKGIRGVLHILCLPIHRLPVILIDYSVFEPSKQLSYHNKLNRTTAKPHTHSHLSLSFISTHYHTTITNITAFPHALSHSNRMPRALCGRSHRFLFYHSDASSNQPRPDKRPNSLFCCTWRGSQWIQPNPNNHIELHVT